MALWTPLKSQLHNLKRSTLVDRLLGQAIPGVQHVRRRVWWPGTGSIGDIFVARAIWGLDTTGYWDVSGSTGPDPPLLWRQNFRTHYETSYRDWSGFGASYHGECDWTQWPPVPDGAIPDHIDFDGVNATLVGVTNNPYDYTHGAGFSAKSVTGLSITGESVGEFRFEFFSGQTNHPQGDQDFMSGCFVTIPFEDILADLIPLIIAAPWPTPPNPGDAIDYFPNFYSGNSRPDLCTFWMHPTAEQNFRGLLEVGVGSDAFLSTSGEIAEGVRDPQFDPLAVKTRFTFDVPTDYWVAEGRIVNLRRINISDDTNDLADVDFVGFGTTGASPVELVLSEPGDTGFVETAGSLSCGRVRFAIIGETPQAWQSRTGITLNGL